MKLRSIELALPDPAAAAAFMVDIWGLADGGVIDGTHYLRGSGNYPYLVSFAPHPEEFVRTTTFVCAPEELAALIHRITDAGWPICETVSGDPGGGRGIITELPDGELLRFLTDTTTVEPLPDRHDMAVKLTHVVFNSSDAEVSGDAAETVLGFRVSDRTRGMVFVRCNQSHHSTAFARAGFASLNHIAFEMEDLDAVMRGIGRLRDHGYAPAWGPGRHGPGANVYAYYIAPFGPVIEFSTAVEQVPEDYRAGAPEDWTWPPNRIDQWGISDKDFDGLRKAEQRFCFRREWQPQNLSTKEPN